MGNLRPITVKLQPELFEQIKTIAEKNGMSYSDTVRYLISRGLDEKIHRENVELISQIVREQIEQALNSYMPVLQPKPKYSREVDPRRLALCRKTG
ncbi:MAG: hypothetical protein GX207_06660 [Peptococcaceae bacterium]|nr:hypothetical protein [Peptococcaceae bacterium]